MDGTNRPDEHGPRVEQNEQTEADARFDGGGRRELVTRSPSWPMGSDHRLESSPSRTRSSRRDAFRAAHDEIPLHENAECTLVLRRCDLDHMIMREPGRLALRRVGLGCDHVEVLLLGVRDHGQRNSRLSDLDAVDTDATATSRCDVSNGASLPPVPEMPEVGWAVPSAANERRRVSAQGGRAAPRARLP